MSTELAFVVLVLSSAFAATDAKACYKCDSSTDPFSSSCFNPSKYYVGRVLCPDSYYCTHISYNTQNKYVVSRGCEYQVDTCNSILRHIKAYHPDVSNFACYPCLGNDCNKVPDITPFRRAEVSENAVEKE